ncbi:hypothetical protein M2432_001575 [Mycobacterium sp. OTB74]|jgi:hypothetical protein|nr:hypothetical protein [Mycobacterium sp. OTB74]
MGRLRERVVVFLPRAHRCRCCRFGRRRVEICQTGGPFGVDRLIPGSPALRALRSAGLARWCFRTRRSGFAPSRLASRQPALPAPTMMKSNSATGLIPASVLQASDACLSVRDDRPVRAHSRTCCRGSPCRRRLFGQLLTGPVRWCGSGAGDQSGSWSAHRTTRLRETGRSMWTRTSRAKNYQIAGPTVQAQNGEPKGFRGQ